MSAAERYKAAEIARLRRTLEKPDLLPEEREYAAGALKRLLDGPTCPHCLEPVKAHNGAKCPVIDRFQRRKGRDSMPTPEQAAEIRESFKADEQAKAATERRKDAKSRQTGFGF